MLDTFLPAFKAFKFLAKGQSEACDSRGVSEGTRTIGPRLVNKGRKVAMEAAMIPRFISSLFFVWLASVDRCPIQLRKGQWYK